MAGAFPALGPWGQSQATSGNPNLSHSTRPAAKASFIWKRLSVGAMCLAGFLGMTRGSRTHLCLGCSQRGIEPLCPYGGCFAGRPSEGWLGSWALCRVPWSLPSVISFGHNFPEGIENSVLTHNGVDHQAPQTPRAEAS